MSTSETNLKYRQIIDTAHELFWKFGIKRVTVEEICTEAGVSKMTYYRYFKHKADLAKAVIEEIFEKNTRGYKELMSQNMPFEDKIKEQVRLKFEGTHDISEAFVSDVYSGWNKEISAIFAEKAQEMVQMVKDDYREAQEKGWIRKDVNVDFIFYLSNKMTEMVSDPNLVGMYNNVQEVIMEFMNMMFYGILPRNDN